MFLCSHQKSAGNRNHRAVEHTGADSYELLLDIIPAFRFAEGIDRGLEHGYPIVSNSLYR